MDFDLDDDQRAILEAVEQLLARHAGAERAVALQAAGEYDVELDRALREAGFTEVARDAESGWLEAALIAEAVSRAAGSVAFAGEALVAPAFEGENLEGPIAICTTDHRGPVRFAAQARSLLLLAGDEARVVRLGSGEVKPVASNFGFPMGDVAEATRRGGRSLGAGSAPLLERHWRLALGIEAVGAMSAALAQPVGDLKERKQFGRRIASFQAVQHRLAECAISVQASRWLCLEAAHQAAPGEMTATAVAYAMQAAEQVFSETHQLSGAIGFTREHDLHVHSMRLQALRLECGGGFGHRRALVGERWGGT